MPRMGLVGVMRGFRAMYVCLAVAMSLAHAATPALPGPEFPSFESAAALNTFCDQGLQRAKARLGVLERQAADGRWLAAYDILIAQLEDWAGPVYLLSNVHPNKALRDAAETCELRWQDFS